MEKGPRAALARPFALSSWSLALAVCGVLAAVSSSLGSIYALPKLLLLALGIMPALLQAAGSAGVRPAPEALRRSPVLRPLAALWAVLILSTAFSRDPLLSLLGQYRMHAYGLLPLGLCTALFLAVVWSEQRRNPLFLLRCCLVAGSVVAVYGLLQKAGVEPLAGLPAALPQGRVTSLFGNPVYLGSVLLMLAPVALHLARLGQGFDRALGAGAGLLISGCLILTVSRAAWIGAAAGCGFYLILAARPQWGRVLLMAGASALLAAACLGASRLRATSMSDSARVQLWASSLQVARYAPLLGTGPDTFQLGLRRYRTEGFQRVMGNRGQASAHNDLLQVLATLGLTGLAAYLWLMVGVARLVRDALADEKRRCLAAALGGALLGLFLQAKFNPVPLSSLGLAAVFTGLLSAAGEAPASSWLKRGVAFFSILALLLVLRLCLADAGHKRALRHQAAGRMELALLEHERSLRLNPTENQYRFSESKLLLKAASSAADEASRAGLLARAEAVGRAAVVWRPADVDSYQMLGAALLMAQTSGGADRLEEAQRVLARAAELDPWFSPILSLRLRLARLRGDLAGEAVLAAELERLEKLEKMEAPL